MKPFFVLIVSFITLTALGQQMTLTQWNEEAKLNVRLLPKYGNAVKSPEQKLADEKFIEETMASKDFNGDRTVASNYLIKLGFSYMNKKDLKTAMYRFNQAYLLDANNADIYWGYGSVYMVLGDKETGLKQYEEGLIAKPDNTHILTDYGTYYLSRYYAEKDAKLLNTGLTYLLKSYKIDAADQNTLYKLSIFYYLKDDCKTAFKYYDACKALGGKPIVQAFIDELTQKCGSR